MKDGSFDTDALALSVFFSIFRPDFVSICKFILGSDILGGLGLKQFNRPHRFCPKLASTKILSITGDHVSDCLRLQLLSVFLFFSKFWLSVVNSACGFGYRQHLSRDYLAFQSFTTYVWPGTSREKMPRQRWSLDSSRFCLLSGFVDLARREMFYWTPHSSV